MATNNLYEVFESKSCTRCGGEGRLIQHSNVIGGTCFKCGGAKMQYTTRGQKDRDAYRVAVEAATVRPVSDVKVGDFVKSDNMKKYVQVLAIGEPRRSSWQGIEGTDSYKPSFQVEITLTHAVWHDMHCPLSYKGDKFSICTDQNIQIHAGKDNMPVAESFDSRKAVAQ